MKKYIIQNIKLINSIIFNIDHLENYCETI